LKLLEVLADSDDFGNPGTVIELKHGYNTIRVHFAKVRAVLLAMRQIDGDFVEYDILLRREYAHTTRAWRTGAVV
jgi:hypothetical protein